jgi:lipoprotein-anchoring transpeptidase ErfK/SrfK
VVKNISISPTAEVIYQWSNRNRKLTIVPKDGWRLEEKYAITINNSRNVLMRRGDFQFKFSTQAYPRVESFYPENGAKDVVFNLEDPIAVRFDRPLEKFKIRFLVAPDSDFASQVSFTEQTIRLVPKKELILGQKYSIRVFVKHQQEKEEAYREIFFSEFETKPPAPIDWDKDFSLRLEQARRFTDPKIKTGKYIDINLKSQILTFFEEGKLLDAFLVSTGRRGMETPQGSFAIRNKAPRPWSKKYSLFMPYWMAVVPSGEFGIHELPEWPGGYKEGANHLGIPVSHGCIRLGVGPAERVYNWAEIGTPVNIHY